MKKILILLVMTSLFLFFFSSTSIAIWEDNMESSTYDRIDDVIEDKEVYLENPKETDKDLNSPNETMQEMMVGVDIEQEQDAVSGIPYKE